MARSYHHGNLRPALVEAAVELARTGGPDTVVLREVARRTGVSHNAAYRHFADRHELLAEVAAFGMDRLEQAMREGIAAVRTRDPVRRSTARLRATGRTYVAFALAEPGLFRVAFAELPTPPTPPSIATEDLEALVNAGPYGVLNAVLDEMVEVGAMPAHRRPTADVTCWAIVHGFATLHLDGPLQALPAELRAEALERALTTIEEGLTRA